MSAHEHPLAKGCAKDHLRNKRRDEQEAGDQCEQCKKAESNHSAGKLTQCQNAEQYSSKYHDEDNQQQGEEVRCPGDHTPSQAGPGSGPQIIAQTFDEGGEQPEQEQANQDECDAGTHKIKRPLCNLLPGSLLASNG